MADTTTKETKETIVESENSKQQSRDLKKEKIDKLKAGLFFTFVTTFGVISGFGLSLSSTKKRETEDIESKDLRKLYALQERGVELARKALFRATVYSVSGFSLFCLAVWTWSGASTFQQFKERVGQCFPKLSKPEDKKGRTEFKNLTDLLQYVIDEDQKKKVKKD